MLKFSTSVIKQGGRKLNYYDSLMTRMDVACQDALRRICPRVDLDQIGSFIDSVPYITDLQKKFYKKYIFARYKLIIRPAFELAMAGRE